MASNHEAKLTVKADVADASRKMHDLEMSVQRLEKQLAKKAKTSKEAAKATDTIGGSMLSVGSKVANLATGLQSAVSMLDDFGQRASAMASVSANFSGNIESLRKATRGLVDDQALMIASNNAQILGVTKTGAEFEQLAAAAAKLGSAVGVDAATAIKDVTEALGKGSPEVLNNIGVILKAEEAQKEYAAQLGKTTAQLTEAEKADAFRVIGMQRVIEKANGVNESTAKMGEGIQRLNVFVKNAVDNLGLLDQHILDFMREIALAAEDGSVFAQALDAITFSAASSGRELERLLRLVDEANARVAALESREDELDRDLAKQMQDTDDMWDEIVSRRFAKGDRSEFVMSEIPRLMKDHAQSIMAVQGAMSLLDAEVRKDVYGKIKRGVESIPKAKGQGGGRGGRASARPSDMPLDVSGLLDTGVEDASVRAAEARVTIAERQLRLESAQEASLERRWQLQTKLFEAELAAIEAKSFGVSSPEEAAALQEEREQLLFDRQVERAEYQIALSAKRAAAEEAAARRIAEAHRRTAQAIDNASSLSGTAIQGVADIASTAAEQHGQSAEDAERKRRAWGAAILAVDAIFYAAKAAAAFAALNPIEGAGFLLAATISGAKAAQMGASVSGVGAGGGGGTSPGFQDRGPRARETREAPTSKVPGSQGASPAALPSSAGPSGGTVVYVNTQVLGAIDDEAAVKISRGLENAMRSGRVKMGRPS